MLIRVVYRDNRYDFVKPSRLDDFLEGGKISMFRRKSGWVFVGIDPIRANTASSYLIKDRRQRREE